VLPATSTQHRSGVESVRLALGVGAATAIGYTMVGYPLLMAARARLSPRPPRRDTRARPSITILVPAHDEADVIARKLETLLALDYPAEQLEILVVDDGSTDGTSAIVERYLGPTVRCLTRWPRAGKMAALNAGIADARGELIVLTDASATFDTDALVAVLAPFADRATGVVSGQNLIRGGGGAVEQPAGLYWRYQERLRAWESATGSTVGVTGNLFVFRRDAYRPLPDDTINDEFAIAMDIAGRGGRVLYEPDAVAYDEASASMSEEMSRRTRINAGRYQSLGRYCGAVARQPSMLFRLVSHKVLRVLTPVLMLTLVAASRSRRRDDPSIRHPRLAALERRLLVPGQIGVYGAAAAGALLERADRPIPRAVAVPYYFVASNLAALRGLGRFSRGRQSVMWDKRSAWESPRGPVSDASPSPSDGPATSGAAHLEADLELDARTHP
jgi:poly-beta-1,6-N-acetyl-D-glucosamine synthase